MPEFPPAANDIEDARKGTRAVFMKDEGRQEIPVYERARLGHGHELLGPSLVEAAHTTIFIPAGWKLSVDQYNNTVLEEVRPIKLPDR